LSADAIRANGGVTPPPEPILPSQFVVHLYNPDQQIVVRYKPKTWNSPATWDFEMPQHSFRQPSSSTLDRTQIDPAIADVTPKLRFGWRKDSKLSKDLACLLSGKTASIPENKTKSKEPDITISIFKGLREMTLYEPNLYRVEMEDFKGLECVLLLGAVTIRDVFFTSIEKAFSISHDLKKPQKTPQDAAAVQKPVQKPGSSTATPVANGLTSHPQPQPQQTPAMSGALAANNKPRPTGAGAGPERPRITIPQQNKPLPEAVSHPSQPQPQPRPQQPQSQQVRFSPGTKPDDDLRRQKKAQEANDKARRKKHAEIEKETKRLQKIYGREEEQVRRSQQQRPAQPQSQPQPQRPAQHRPTQSHPSSSRPHLPPRPGPGPGSGPYLHVPPSQAGPNRRPNAHASVQFLPLQPQHVSSPGLQQKKSSFFGLRRSSEDKNKEKLAKKRSSIF